MQVSDVLSHAPLCSLWSHTVDTHTHTYSMSAHGSVSNHEVECAKLHTLFRVATFVTIFTEVTPFARVDIAAVAGGTSTITTCEFVC